MKQTAREHFKMADKQLNKGLAKKMINPFYSTGGTLQVGFNFTLEIHHIIHANFKKFIKPNYPEIGIEPR